jgi:hypothetical protein
MRQDMPEIVSKAVTDAWDDREATSKAALRELFEEIIARNFERYFGSQQVKLVQGDEEMPPGYLAAERSAAVERLQFCVSHLKSRCQSASLDCLPEVSDGITVHPEIALALERWWGEKKSAFLWVQGLPDNANESSLSAQMVAMAGMMNLPVVSYFCERIGTDGRATTQAELLINVVYSLIYQLVQNISSTSDFSSTTVLVPDRFEQLDGTPASLSLAINILREILSVGPSYVLIVLDGLDLLGFPESDALDEHVIMFLNSLKNPLRVIKILFWTSEQTLILMRELVPEDIVDATLASGSDGFFSFHDFEAGASVSGHV